MKRAKLRGLKRNAAVVLGNVGTEDDGEPLTRVGSEDPEPLVREHAAWALGRIGAPDALEPLRARLAVESEAWVCEELGSAVRALVD